MTLCLSLLQSLAKTILLKGAINLTKISETFDLKLNGSIRSNRKSFEKSGPPFEVDHFSRLDRSDRKFRPILNPRTSLFGIFHVQNGGKYLSLHFYGLLTADVSVLLVHPCTVTTGL